MNRNIATCDHHSVEVTEPRVPEQLITACFIENLIVSYQSHGDVAESICFKAASNLVACD